MNGGPPGVRASAVEAPRAWLLSSPAPLTDRFDVALLDLDGTVYAGRRAIPGAVGMLAAARHAGLRMAFVTNNAARTPQEVATRLAGLGVPAGPAEVVTSAQAAAGVLAGRLPPGSSVLVVGGAGLVDALAEVGLRAVRSADDEPAAVVQGWAPELDWRMLAEGAYALARGLPWVACNTDATIPTGRGTAPGNGSFVALLGSVTGRAPDAVAGKPAPTLLERAAARTAASRPLVVGDRLDTDVEGAHAAGLPSLLVLTGVTDPLALLAAPPRQRPSYVAASLAGLLTEHRAPVQADDGSWRCGRAAAVVDAAGDLVVPPEGDPSDELDPLRAACAAAWVAADSGQRVTLPSRWPPGR